ncbi:hypothetical protein [Thermomonas sp.]|uniref:hypothetical protein n=1 Tax=Thermomonas sp. TaxID=1971895 RepID=UPI003D123800
MNIISKIEQGLGDMDDAARVQQLAAASAAVLTLPDECWEQSPAGPSLRIRLARALARVLEDAWRADAGQEADDGHAP